MDLISAHRQGLVELIAAEAEGLAGRDAALAQRVIVYVHLYEQAGQGHDAALLAARGTLALPGALARLQRQARRWWHPARRRGGPEAVARFAAAAQAIDRARCVAMVSAFRFAATPALAAEAAETLGPALSAAFGPCLAARREGGVPATARWALFDAHDLWLAARLDPLLRDAEALLPPGFSKKAVGAVLACLRAPAEGWEATERRGWARLRAQVIGDASLPAGFAANPGRFYFRLLNQVAERRRREWLRDELPDAAVLIAA